MRERRDKRAYDSAVCAQLEQDWTPGDLAALEAQPFGLVEALVALLAEVLHGLAGDVLVLRAAGALGLLERHAISERVEWRERDLGAARAVLAFGSEAALEARVLAPHETVDARLADLSGVSTCRGLVGAGLALACNLHLGLLLFRGVLGTEVELAGGDVAPTAILANSCAAQQE